MDGGDGSLAMHCFISKKASSETHGGDLNTDGEMKIQKIHQLDKLTGNTTHQEQLIKPA